MRVHVLPIFDVIEHDDNEDCFCGPSAEFVEGGVVFVHHSVDGREFSEPDWVSPNGGNQDASPPCP